MHSVLIMALHIKTRRSRYHVFFGQLLRTTIRPRVVAAAGAHRSDPECSSRRQPVMRRAAVGVRGASYPRRRPTSTPLAYVLRGMCVRLGAGLG